MRKLPRGFDIYLVNVKTLGKIVQIFVAFSEKLNFNIDSSPQYLPRLNDFVYRKTFVFIVIEPNLMYAPALPRVFSVASSSGYRICTVNSSRHVCLLIRNTDMYVFI